jgi:hypothetical protein
MLFLDGMATQTCAIDEWASLASADPAGSMRGQTAMVPEALLTQHGLAALHQHVRPTTNDGAGDAAAADGGNLADASTVDHRVGLAHATMAQLLAMYDRSNGTFCHTAANRQQLRWSIALLCGPVIEILKTEQACLPAVPQPLLTFGDLHGSFADLAFAFAHACPLRDVRYAFTKTLFLGDYVDRGASSVEVVAFLLAWKFLAPRSVFLLRGNHEDPHINGNCAEYGDTCLRRQCAALCDGAEVDGEVMWNEINRVFAAMPVAALTDGGVLLTHGGIPAPTTLTPTAAAPFSQLDTLADRINAVCRSVPDWRFATLLPDARDAPAVAKVRALLRQLAWNDPAPGATAPARNDMDAFLALSTTIIPGDLRLHHDAHQVDAGFLRNEARGDVDGAVLEFTPAAVDDFFRRWNLRLLIRAHQHKDRGLQLAHNARVLTVFTSSNYARGNAAGGCLIHDERVRLFSWAPPRGADTPIGQSAAYHRDALGASSVESMLWHSSRVPLAQPADDANSPFGDATVSSATDNGASVVAPAHADPHATIDDEYTVG